jgi:hypothetical protein
LPRLAGYSPQGLDERGAGVVERMGWKVLPDDYLAW